MASIGVVGGTDPCLRFVVPLNRHVCLVWDRWVGGKVEVGSGPWEGGG